jgi:acyl-CoA thioester hydrolase
MDADTGNELANGEVIVVAYDYREGKTIPVPEEWKEKIIAFEGLQV